MERIIGSLVTDSILEEYRKNLDPHFHEHYVLRRRQIQNNIVRKILSTVPISSIVSDGSFFQMVVVAGPIGSGKSFLVQMLKKATDNYFLHIDMNAIRCELPECKRYQTQCPHLFANITQKESGAICELLIYAALSLHIPIILDSTLRDIAWHRNFFQALISKYSGLNIQLIHITSSEDSIIRRIELRNQQPCIDRVVCKQTVSDSYQILYSLQKIKKQFSDVCCNIIGIDNSFDCGDAVNFEPKVVFPWHLNWTRVKYLLKIESPEYSKNHSREYRLFQSPDTTTSTVTEDYFTANDGFTNTSTFSEVPNNYYTSEFMETKTTLDETCDSNDFDIYSTSLFETAPINGISLPNCSNESQQSNEKRENNSGKSTVYADTWMIERLRLYHNPQNSKHCSHPSRSYPCFLCRIDKVPNCCQSLSARSATLCSNTLDTKKYSKAKKSCRLHTYPSIR